MEVLCCIRSMARWADLGSIGPDCTADGKIHSDPSDNADAEVKIECANGGIGSRCVRFDLFRSGGIVQVLSSSDISSRLASVASLTLRPSRSCNFKALLISVETDEQSR